MISDMLGDAESDVITIVGSDDGTKFWTINGSWVEKDSGSILVDFSPKGGPSDLSGTFSCASQDNNDCKITWQDGNAWHMGL